MGEILQVGDLAVAVRRSSRRSTLGLTVERDGSLTLAAPVDCSTERIESFVYERRSWVYRKLARKEMLTREVAPKEYVSGESFPYLGRNYRLKLVETSSQEVPLRLHQGWFVLRRDALEEAKEHFVQWYSRRALPWLSRRVALLGPRVGARPDLVEVRDLGYRWGSASSRGAVYFHWRTILLPAAIAEYVVAHELVHLRVPDHSAEFWLRLARVMPEYVQRKEWLAHEGAATPRL